MKLHKQQLVEAGWQETPLLDTIYQHAIQLIDQKNITEFNYLKKHLKRDFPGSHGSLKMLQSPAPLSLAIQAKSKDAIKNLAKSQKQMEQLLCCPVIERGVLMPDACPAGNAPAVIPVGGAIAVKNAIIPAAHSADICCSLHASFFVSELDTSSIMDALQLVTRFGPGGRPEDEQVHHPVLDEAVWNNRFLRRLEQKAKLHMADQGDGNHFANLGELQVSALLLVALRDNGQIDLANALAPHASVKVLVTHHGSRGLGAALYKRGLDAAIKHTRKHAKGIPEQAAWLSMSTAEGQAYWDALQYVSRWTKANHESIHARFHAALTTQSIASIGNEHNFIWKRDDVYLHGKGATPAWASADGYPLLGLIPLNMAEPILLTVGSNNSDFLSFSPHGAGRNFARKALLRRYERKRQGIDTERISSDIRSGTHHIDARWYLGEADVTECPIAYKPAAEVRSQIQQYNLAEVIAEIQPLGCIMAGRSPRKEKPLSPKQLRQIQHRADRRKVRQHDWHESCESD
ncbi:MAG: tRNA-splicing ligase RtcB [Crocinitomicaceae bacterium]